MIQPRASRVLIVHDHDIALRSLSILLSHREDVHVVGDVSSAAGARGQANQLEPDLALVDSHLPGGYGIQVSRETRATTPLLKC